MKLITLININFIYIIVEIMFPIRIKIEKNIIFVYFIRMFFKINSLIKKLGRGGNPIKVNIANIVCIEFSEIFSFLFLFFISRIKLEFIIK